MRLAGGSVLFLFLAALSSPALAQGTNAPSPPLAAESGPKHTPVDSAQAMSSAGFRTLPVSDVEGMTLFDSKGGVFGKVRRVIRNATGHDSIVVTREDSSADDVVVPLDDVVIHSDRLFAHGIDEDDLRAMPAVKAGGETQIETSKTIMIGAEE